VIPKSYADLVRKFGQKKVDLAYFGGVTFVQANLFHKAVPLVMRDIDVNFTRYFIIAKNNPAKSIKDLKGKSFSFSSKLSTSGHLMPRYFLSKQKIIPEQYFSKILYSSSHDKTALWVEKGKVEVGAVNSLIVDKMLEGRQLNPEKIRVLWRTPPYPDYVWAIRSGVVSSMKRKILNAFLELSQDDVRHKKILEKVQTHGFLPASVSDFMELQKIIEEIKIFGREKK
jgi:phosphonate transport system substrate-binding protein